MADRAGSVATLHRAGRSRKADTKNNCGKSVNSCREVRNRQSGFKVVGPNVLAAILSKGERSGVQGNRGQRIVLSTLR